MSELTGINPAMQTPMHADGSIDYARWKELIDLYIDAGVHGLVLGAGAGQHPYLTQQECNGCNSHTDTAGSLPTAYRHDIVESRNLRLVGMCEQGPGSLEAIALHESSEG